MISEFLNWGKKPKGHDYGYLISGGTECIDILKPLCWKLSTNDLKFPRGRWYLNCVLSSWLLAADGPCLCLRMSVVNSIIKHHLPSIPFPSWTLKERPTRKVRPLGTKETYRPKLVITQAHPRLLRASHWTPTRGRPGNRCWALCSLDLSTDCFDFCDYVLVMCSQCTNYVHNLGSW